MLPFDDVIMIMPTDNLAPTLQEPLSLTMFNFSPAWITYDMSSKLCDGIAYFNANFNGTAQSYTL